MDDFYAEQYLQPEARRRQASSGEESNRLALREKPLHVQSASRHEPRAPLGSVMSRRIRVAVAPERFDIGSPTPCAYIRLLQPLSHPGVAGDFDVVMVDQESALDCQADIIVTQRFAVTSIQAAERLAAHARATGAALVYDLDDDLLNVPRTHPDAAELRPLAKVARRMLTLADAVWVSTPALARRLAPLRPDALVIENRLDERIWACAPPRPRTRQTPVRILAMGTTTHDRDYRLIEPALQRLKAEYDNRVSIDILGMTNQPELPEGLNRIGPSMNAVRSYPGFVHWLTNVQPSWHIGLAPLLDSPFNASKSAVKAMDYAALGAVVLASDVDVYRGSLADGPAGALVANTAQDWYAALDRMVRDVDRRNALAGGLRDVFLKDASLASQAPARRAALLAALHSMQPRAASAA